MKRFISGLLTLALVLSSVVSTAHEGMWLPLLIKRLNMAEMQANGLNLTAEELYDINNASVKDAIVRFSGESYERPSTLSKNVSIVLKKEFLPLGFVVPTRR